MHNKFDFLVNHKIFNFYLKVYRKVLFSVNLKEKVCLVGRKGIFDVLLHKIKLMIKNSSQDALLYNYYFPGTSKLCDI